MRLLAAEDAEVNRILLKELLRQEGAEVAFAEDGEQAVQCVHEHGAAAFDVILMDVQMPVLDGYEGRIHAVHPQLPVIGPTADGLSEVGYVGRRTGFGAQNGAGATSGGV